MQRDGRNRVVIDRVQPEVDCGRFPVKRVVGDKVRVEADVFADGHDELTAVLLHRTEGASDWIEVRMEEPDNDRWAAQFTVNEVGRHRYTVRGWLDRFGSWHRDLAKKLAAGQDVSQELLAGAHLVQRACRRARGDDATRLTQWAKRLRSEPVPAPPDGGAPVFPELAALMERYPDRRSAVVHGKELTVVVDRERAGFSAWYELFPRSASDEPGRHGTFKDVERRLPYIAAMGFDVVYLPPIHPIGHSFRKGKNNVTVAAPSDPGSPWAIGSEEGGHTAVHPELGTVEDYEGLVRAAWDHGMEIALDLAYQCSADHPWLKDHPEWFRRRPDGSIRYAENPPKKYQDIYAIDFETPSWRELWQALRSVVDFWIGRGVRIFRVDNPHTKPFAFWEWMIGEVKAEHPDVIFLSEAFTRPKVMYRLAKVGFTQSYTYFTWRNSKRELEHYFGVDLSEVRDFFRPNLWPNTPDILHETLQKGGRPAFMSRLILAATLGANYGIYGPAFELMEHIPLAAAGEEYLNSEKYEIRHWDLDRADSLADFIARVNRIRRENPALHRDDTLRFHPVDNEHLLAYTKRSPDGDNVILTAVNIDPENVQSGWIDLAQEELGVAVDEPYHVRDLLTGATYSWRGKHNFVMLDPHVVPAHILRIEPSAAARLPA